MHASVIMASIARVYIRNDLRRSNAYMKLLEVIDVNVVCDVSNMQYE